MLDYLDFDSKGKKVVARMDGVNSDMLMDVTVYQMKAGEVVEIEEAEKETAVLLLGGSVKYQWLNESQEGHRENVFNQAPYCLHVCKKVKVKIEALKNSEILVQSTTNEKEFTCRFYTPKDLKVEVMGESQWEGTAKREVVTVFDYFNAPYSNMVIGESITKAGRWSSYIPHSHPQPEVYYYKFDCPQGFGASFIGDSVYKVVDGSASYIPGGFTHPQAAAPGYNMYYCWMIRHLQDKPWTSRDNDPLHTWLLDK